MAEYSYPDDNPWDPTKWTPEEINAAPIRVVISDGVIDADWGISIPDAATVNDEWPDIIYL